MSRLENLILYFKQRYRPLPWFVLPFFLYFFSIQTFEQITAYKLIYAYIFLFSFRLFDDLMCIPYDEINKEVRFYYQDLVKRNLFLFSLLSFSTLLIWTFFIFNEAVLALHLGFICIIFSLYRFLRFSKWILLVSILKYPLLIYCLGDGLNSALMWGSIIFFILLIKEAMDEKFIKNIKFIKMSVLVGAFLFKTYEWGQI